MFLTYKSDPNATSFTECDLDFTSGSYLESAVLISLLTNRRVSTEELPQQETDQAGWFGDNLNTSKIGSKFWLLKRKKMLPNLKKEAQQYVEESLHWLIDDGVASQVVVNTQIFNELLAIDIQIFQNDGKIISFNFDNLWNQIK
jgi:phage gp46-like protein